LESHSGKLSAVVVWFVNFAFKRDEKCAQKLSDIGTLCTLQTLNIQHTVSCEFTLSVVWCVLCTGTPWLMQ